MTNNPFEANNNNNNNRSFEDVNRKSGSGIKIIAVCAIVVIVFLFVSGTASAFFQISQEPEIPQVSLEEFGIGELEAGEPITLNSSNLGECRDLDEYEDFTCLAFNSDQHFKPGLYTVVYEPINYIDDGSYPTLSLHLNFNDYLEFEYKDPNSTDYFSVFPDLDSTFTIENVAFQDNAYIVLYELPKSMEFTLELIPQTEYKPFENKSGVTGFYPVGLTLNPGEYELSSDDDYLPGGEKVVLSYEGLSDDEVEELYIYDRDKFELDDNEIFVSYKPTNKLSNRKK